jgi:CheY-like chemotaxis protein
MPKVGVIPADRAGVATVSVSIGPAPGASARAWLVAAQQTIATVRSRPDLAVPEDVLAAFDRYLDLWSQEMDGDEFRWTGAVDPRVLRRLASHWARLVSLARESDSGSGLLPADPEGEAFFDALALGMADALGRADDAEAFAAKFEEVVPDFDGRTRAPSDEPGDDTIRVLLVDDNPDIRLLVRIGVEASGGLEIAAEAADGQLAVDAVTAGCPDVVLLDLSMPVMDGFAALPLIKARCPECRVVVFSADDSPSARRAVSEAGADAFLRKDAAIATVVAELRRGD